MTTRQQVETIYACICKQNELYEVWAKRNGMSYNTMMVLYALDHGETTQKQIAQGWMIPKQTVNTVVKELERQDLVTLAPGRDNKEKLVQFTAAGRAYVAETLAGLYQREERAMEAMGPRQSQALVESSQAYTQAFADEVLHER